MYLYRSLNTCDAEKIAELNPEWYIHKAWWDAKMQLKSIRHYMNLIQETSNWNISYKDYDKT